MGGSSTRAVLVATEELPQITVAPTTARIASVRPEIGGNGREKMLESIRVRVAIIVISWSRARCCLVVLALLCARTESISTSITHASTHAFSGCVSDEGSLKSDRSTHRQGNAAGQDR